MEFLIHSILQTCEQVWGTFTHNWPFLIISTLVAVSLKFFSDTQKISALLLRYQGGGVVGATILAVFTPLCSCGTTAIVLGMMASTIPWAPIIAFMVSSPLTSPEEVIYSAGLFGWPFALAFFFSSILLGLLGGLVGWYFEKRGWLQNQTRFQDLQITNKITEPVCECDRFPTMPLRSPLYSIAEYSGNCTCSSSTIAVSDAPLTNTCGCGNVTAGKTLPIDPVCDCDAGNVEKRAENKIDWMVFLAECGTTGKRLFLMFFGFAFIGYFLNSLIPTEWVAAIFGNGNIYSVPLAAVLGLPFYINTEASLPLVRALIDGGMSQGAALAFLITGAGTSIGAVTGALTIARWRVIALVVGTLLLGAVVSGFVFNFLLASGII